MLYLYKVFQGLAMNLPIKMAYSLATFLGCVYYFLFPKDRRALEANLSIVTGDRPGTRKLKKCVRNVFVNFAKYLVDFLRFEKIDGKFIEKNVRVFGRENLDKALEKGKGVVLLSSHLGNWELGGTVLAKMGYDMHAIVLPHADPKVNSFFDRQRGLSGLHQIYLGSGLKKCVSVLKKNSVLAILGDRDFTNNGNLVNFFGREAKMPKGAAFFSVKTGAPVVAGFLVRDPDDKFSMFLDGPVGLCGDAAASGDLSSCVKACSAIIEKYVSRYPDQWYVFRKVWG